MQLRGVTGTTTSRGRETVESTTASASMPTRGYLFPNLTERIGPALPDLQSAPGLMSFARDLIEAYRKIKAVPIPNIKARPLLRSIVRSTQGRYQMVTNTLLLDGVTGLGGRDQLGPINVLSVSFEKGRANEPKVLHVTSNDTRFAQILFQLDRVGERAKTAVLTSRDDNVPTYVQFTLSDVLFLGSMSIAGAGEPGQTVFAFSLRYSTMTDQVGVSLLHEQVRAEDRGAIQALKQKSAGAAGLRPGARSWVMPP